MSHDALTRRRIVTAALCATAGAPAARADSAFDWAKNAIGLGPRTMKPLVDPIPPGLAVGAEVYIVSGYEPIGGQCVVHVDRPGKQVVLVLSSFHPLNWIITSSPKTTVRAAIVSEVPQSSEFQSRVTASSQTKVYAARLGIAPNTAQSKPFRRLIREIQTILGVDRVQGRFGIYTLNISYDITEPQNGPELTVEGERPQSSSSLLGGIQFDILDVDLRPVPWTVTGPARGADLRTRYDEKTRAALDPTGTTVYAVQGNKDVLVSIDRRTGTRTELPLPSSFPAMSWPTDVAYDTAQDIVCVSTLGGEGFVYRYDVRDRRWRDYRSLNNIDLHSMAYEARTRSLLAWGSFGDLVMLDDTGRKVMEQPLRAKLRSLTELFDQGNEQVPRLRVIPQGQNLALVAVQGGRIERIWTYNINSGASEYTFRAS